MSAYVGEIELGTKLSPIPENLHKGGEEKFCYWISTIPECNAHHRQSIKRLQKRTLPLSYRQRHTIHYIHVIR